MKALLIALFLFAPILVHAQCVDDTNSICVSRADVARATAAVTELKAARQVIEAFTKEREATDAERASATRLIDRLNSVIAVQDRLNVEYQTVITLYRDTVKMYADLVQKLTEQINKPKSAWQKFAAVLGKVVVLLAGVAIGGGL